MDCYRHEGVACVATCVSCSRPVCEECREEVAGHAMCPPCVAAAEARLASTPPLGSEAQPVLAGEAALADAPAAVTMLSEASAEEVAPVLEGDPPGLFRRLGRGWLWGIWYGQWWTLMTVVSGFIWGEGWPGTVAVVIMAVIYGFFGSVTGIIIGAANASPGTGSTIGVGVGVTVCLLETLLAVDARGLINLIWYFFTGQFVGAGIAGRVQRPVLSRKG
jgi:hypothetical protein